MVWRLVKDTVWRMRGMYLMTALPMGALWMAAGHDGWIMTATALAASMGLTFMDGPFIGLAAYIQSESAYLPMSRRQLWRARWTVALVVPVAFFLAVKLLVLGATRLGATGGAISLPLVLLSSVYDLAYAGAGFGFLTWSGLWRMQSRNVNRSYGSGLWVAAVTVFILGPAWPLLFRTALATGWNHLSGRGWLLLGATLGVALASLFYSPIAHAGRRHWGTAGRTKTAGSEGPSRPAIGIARLMWPEIAMSVGFFVLLAVMFRFFSIQSDAGDSSAINFLYFMILVSVSMPSPATMGPRAVLRSLRSLPLSTWTLSAILSAQPVVAWLAIWMLQAAARQVFSLPVPVLTPNTLWWLIGISSVLTAAGIRLAGSGVLRFGLIAPLVIGLVAFDRLHVVQPIASLGPLAAAAGVVAAVWVNSRTLTRGRSVYKPVKLSLPFGMPVPPS